MKTEMQILWSSTTDHKELKMLDCHLMQNWRFTTWQNSNLCLSTSVVVCTTKQIGKAKKAAEKKTGVLNFMNLYVHVPLMMKKQKEKQGQFALFFASFSTKEELSGMRFNDVTEMIW